jgi:hypothetical protein
LISRSGTGSPQAHQEINPENLLLDRRGRVKVPSSGQFSGTPRR